MMAVVVAIHVVLHVNRDGWMLHVLQTRFHFQLAVIRSLKRITQTTAGKC